MLGNVGLPRNWILPFLLPLPHSECGSTSFLLRGNSKTLTEKTQIMLPSPLPEIE